LTTIDDYSGYAADAGGGFENQTGEDVSIPFLVILQPGSPEVQGEEATAKAGMIINKTTSEVISGKEGVTFIPALTDHLLVEWIPRDKGGGLVGQHAIDSDLAKAVRQSQPMGTYQHPDNGNDLVETFYVYGVALSADGSPYPATLAFSSTHIKGYKDWMFRARSIVIAFPDGRKLTQVPLFSHAYRIITERQEKNGNTLYTPTVRFADTNAEKSRLSPTSGLYLAAKQVKEAVSAGTLRADTSKLSGDGTHADSAPRRGSVDAKHAPF
jgi:hypothetical protein